MNDKVLVPDIPISEYEDVNPKITKVPFWAKNRSDEVNYSAFLLDADEIELLKKNNEVGRRFSKIQREVGAWAWKNFKEKAQGTNPLLGIIEEVGELAKAILKKDQGIRGTPEKHDRDAVDAIGDIMIYMMNYLNVLEIDMLTVSSTVYLHRVDMSYDTVGNPPSMHQIRKDLVILISRSLSKMHESPGQSFGVIMTYLDMFSRTYGMTLLEVVEKTWSIVGKRNWVEDAMVGGNHTHEG